MNNTENTFLTNSNKLSSENIETSESIFETKTQSESMENIEKTENMFDEIKEETSKGIEATANLAEFKEEGTEEFLKENFSQSEIDITIETNSPKKN